MEVRNDIEFINWVTHKINLKHKKFRRINIYDKVLSWKLW